jgi:hypothetical protein
MVVAAGLHLAPGQATFARGLLGQKMKSKETQGNISHWLGSYHDISRRLERAIVSGAG